MKIVEKRLDEIRPYERNPRRNDAAVEYVANSLREFGWKQPIVIDKNGVIVAGHTRYKAALSLGWETAPCVVADDLTPEQVKAYRLADNKVGEIAEWDMDLLAIELDDLADYMPDIDMRDFGFEEEPESESVVEDNYEPQLPENPKAKVGDIYLLGGHRLMCGDSTIKADVNALMGGSKADLFLTDPPYNVDYHGGTKESMTILNDSMENDRFKKFLSDAFANADYFMNPGAAYYIWHADSVGMNFRCAVKNTAWELKQCLIWVKSTFVLGRQDYQWKHEPCLYGWKKGTHYFTDDRTQATVIDDKIDLNKLKKAELRSLLEEMLSEKRQTTVIYEDKPLVNGVHPTMKPIRLLATLIKNSTRPGQFVLDLFGGSGSTLIACEQLDRTCFMMELDPRYVDVIIDRWETYTGKKAELIYRP